MIKRQLLLTLGVVVLLIGAGFVLDGCSGDETTGRLVLSPKEFNFGKVRRTPIPYEREFTIANGTGKDITIVKVQGNCPCILIVLGLGKEVHRHPARVHRAVTQHHDFRRSRTHHRDGALLRADCAAVLRLSNFLLLLPSSPF